MTLWLLSKVIQSGTKEAMERVWGDETLGGKTRLKVDEPD